MPQATPVPIKQTNPSVLEAVNRCRPQALFMLLCPHTTADQRRLASRFLKQWGREPTVYQQWPGEPQSKEETP